MNFLYSLHSILLIIIMSVINSGCSKKIEQTRPQFSSITESVYTSLTIEPEDLYDVYATNSGIIQKILVKEGDTVTKSQLIAIISSDNQKIIMENAELSLEKSRENYQGKATLLSNIKNEMESMEKKLKLDSINFFRQKTLWDQHIGSKSDLETKQLKYEYSIDNLNLLKQKYIQATLDLKNTFLQSQNLVRKEKSNFNDYLITSRIDGRVYSLFKNEGERINQQDVLAKIGKQNQFIIKMYIDEVDITKVSPGQKVLISLDAYKDQVYTASVLKIYPQKDKRNQTFEIEGVFNDKPPVLYSGLTGEGNIIVDEHKNSMIIPLDYLMSGNMVKTTKGEIRVQTGLKNMEYIEIISGLDTSAVLLKP